MAEPVTTEAMYPGSGTNATINTAATIISADLGIIFGSQEANQPVF
jgi:hypothetical protein